MSETLTWILGKFSETIGNRTRYHWRKVPIAPLTILTTAGEAEITGGDAGNTLVGSIFYVPLGVG